MTLKDYIGTMKSRFLPQKSDIGSEAIEQLIATIKDRVHNKGLNTAGTSFSYGTKEWGYDKSEFVNKSAFRANNYDGTMTLKGWNEVRGVQGMRNDTVLWDYSGKMKKGLKKQGNKIVMSGSRNVQVYSENKEKYGELYDATKQELEAYAKAFALELKKKYDTR